MTTYVLWGLSPAYGDQPIKLTAGTRAWVDNEHMYRKSERGWLALVVAPEGKRPWFPGDPQ